MIIRLVAVSLIIFAFSCSHADVEKKHHQAVTDGYKKLPTAKSFRDRFGAWSFITHWNMTNDSKYGWEENEKEWQSISYIYDRYELIYTQRVFVERNGGLIVTSKEPKLLIREISRIFGDPNAPTTDFSEMQITLEGEVLQKLVGEDWNFEAIGLILKKSEPLANFQWKYDYWNRIYPLQEHPNQKGTDKPSPPSDNTPLEVEGK